MAKLGLISDGNNKMNTFYHGSNNIVKVPDLSQAREDVDFGRGFCLTENFKLAAKWASKESSSVVNEYTFSQEGLNVHTFGLDEEWLDYVCVRRQLDHSSEVYKKYENYDVLKGAIADDKLFSMIDMYEMGYIKADVAVKIMNCMDYGVQTVIKTQKAVERLQYQKHELLQGKKKEQFRTLYVQDNKEGSRKASELLRIYNKNR